MKSKQKCCLCGNPATYVLVVVFKVKCPANGANSRIDPLCTKHQLEERIRYQQSNKVKELSVYQLIVGEYNDAYKKEKLT